MTIFQHKKSLFHQKEISGYLCRTNEKLYRVYEIKDEKVLHTLLSYQEKWQYEVSLVYKYPIFIFKHEAMQWYVFKEIDGFSIEQRFKICLSFLEKLLLMEASVEEILFFCDSTNLWFNEQCNCEVFYKPKVVRLIKEVTKEYALMVLAKFLFRHIQLEQTLEDEKLYNEAYVTFYQHAFATHYYLSLLQIYDEVYQAYHTYHKQVPEPLSWATLRTKIMTIGIYVAVVYVFIIYSIYAIGTVKRICDEQFHDLYKIGDQSLQKNGESP